MVYGVGFSSVFSTLSGASDTACLEGVVGKARIVAPLWGVAIRVLPQPAASSVIQR
jgi:hypothetical protein